MTHLLRPSRSPVGPTWKRQTGSHRPGSNQLGWPVRSCDYGCGSIQVDPAPQRPVIPSLQTGSESRSANTHIDHVSMKVEIHVSAYNSGCSCNCSVKGIVHPKMKMIPWFIPPLSLILLWKNHGIIFILGWISLINDIVHVSTNCDIIIMLWLRVIQYLVTRILYAELRECALLTWANQYLPRTTKQATSHVLATNRTPKPSPSYALVATQNPLRMN